MRSRQKFSWVQKEAGGFKGNHFALSFGRDQKKHSGTIQKIIDKYQVPYFKRLVERLLELGHDEAAQEVREVISHHVAEIKRAGIKLDTANFGDLLID